MMSRSFMINSLLDLDDDLPPPTKKLSQEIANSQGKKNTQCQFQSFFEKLNSETYYVDATDLLNDNFLHMLKD